MTYVLLILSESSGSSHTCWRKIIPMHYYIVLLYCNSRKADKTRTLEKTSNLLQSTPRLSFNAIYKTAPNNSEEKCTHTHERRTNKRIYSRKNITKEVACMPGTIKKKGQRACTRNTHKNRGRRERKVVRCYVKCAPPVETRKEFVSSAHSRTLTLSPFLQKRSRRQREARALRQRGAVAKGGGETQRSQREN